MVRNPRGIEMRALVLLAAIAMAPAESVFAAETGYAEFDVIAVAPRSPDVQPYFLSVPARGRPKVPQNPQLANSGKETKSADAPSGIRQQKASAKAVRPMQRIAQAEE